jgi:hypothetical protein
MCKVDPKPSAKPTWTASTTSAPHAVRDFKEVKYNATCVPVSSTCLTNAIQTSSLKCLGKVSCRGPTPCPEWEGTACFYVSVRLSCQCLRYGARKGQRLSPSLLNAATLSTPPPFHSLARAQTGRCAARGCAPPRAAPRTPRQTRPQSALWAATGIQPPAVTPPPSAPLLTTARSAKPAAFASLRPASVSFGVEGERGGDLKLRQTALCKLAQLAHSKHLHPSFHPSQLL